MNISEQLKKYGGGLLAMLVVFALSACDSSSQSSSGAGLSTFSRTTVKGNVSASSFSSGGLGGISVAIVNRSSVTDAQGNFQLSDVPPGKQTIIFSKGGERASLPLDVKANATLTLKNIVVGRNSASGPQNTIPPRPAPPSSPPSRPGNDDDDSDDDSDDDKDDD